MTQHRLSSEQAAARLGVKKATLYAYVSRGLLSKSLSEDGRSSSFDPREVDALRDSRRRSARGELATVISSSITQLREDGHRYRDCSVKDCIQAGQSFEEVVDTLWLASYEARLWRWSDEQVAPLLSAQKALPANTPYLDRLRVNLSLVSALDPMRAAATSDNFRNAGRAILMGMVRGLSPRGKKSYTLAKNLWQAIAPTHRREAKTEVEAKIRCLECALILLADHGLATSTYAVRVAASVRADPYSVIATGLGAVAGTLHGCAGQAVVSLYSIAAQSSPEEAIGEYLSRGETIPGFGHLVYQRQDPRYTLLMECLAEAWHKDSRLSVVLSLAKLAQERLSLVPNVDLALGAIAWLGGFPRGIPAIFGVARTAGWIAHAMEELEESPLRFRPTARYVPNS